MHSELNLLTSEEDRITRLCHRALDTTVLFGKLIKWPLKFILRSVLSRAANRFSGLAQVLFTGYWFVRLLYIAKFAKFACFKSLGFSVKKNQRAYFDKLRRSKIVHMLAKV